MKIMGEITCRLNADAVKKNILYCSEPESYRLDAWTVSATWLTALATVALAVIAIIAGLTALQTLRQMKSDSIQQTRPYVYAQVVPSIAGMGVYDLVIKNTGKTTAQSLLITCPEFPEDADDIADKLRSFFLKNHSLPPNSQLRTFWRFTVTEGTTWKGGSTDPAGMPEIATIIVKYKSSNRTYTESFPVDLGIYTLSPVPDGGPNPLMSLSADQKDTHKMLAVIARNIRELGR